MIFNKILKTGKVTTIILYYNLLLNNRKLYKAKNINPLRNRRDLFMKKIISITLEEDLIRWLEKYSKDNQKYRNKSHFVEVAIRALKKKEEEE